MNWTGGSQPPKPNLPPSQVERDFNRPAEPTAIKVSSKIKVAKAKVVEAMGCFVDEAGIPAESMLGLGPNVGKIFTVRSAGTELLAANKAAKFPKSLRKGDGTWKKPLVLEDTGASVRRGP